MILFSGSENGAVYRALNFNMGQIVFMKRIGLDGPEEEDISQLTREVDLVMRCSACRARASYERMTRDENTLALSSSFIYGAVPLHALLHAAAHPVL